jgi:hypothetical protein
MNTEKHVKILYYSTWGVFVLLSILIYFARKTGVQEAKSYTDKRIDEVYIKHTNEVKELFKEKDEKDSIFADKVINKLDTLLNNERNK